MTKSDEGTLEKAIETLKPLFCFMTHNLSFFHPAFSL